MDMFIYNRGDDPERDHWITPRREWYGDATWRGMKEEEEEQITSEALARLGYATERLQLPQVDTDGA